MNDCIERTAKENRENSILQLTADMGDNKYKAMTRKTQDSELQ